MKKILGLLLILAGTFASAQSPQTQTAPIYPVNAKYTNGVAPGYADLRFLQRSSRLLCHRQQHPQRLSRYGCGFVQCHRRVIVHGNDLVIFVKG